ncbi:MAG: CHRD domain-containing protein [Nitrososphaeraceae archaeon]
MGDSVKFSVNASNIQGITAGLIHRGKQGENGPVVVTLFNYASPMNQVAEKESLRLTNLKDQWLANNCLTWKLQ